MSKNGKNSVHVLTRASDLFGYLGERGCGDGKECMVSVDRDTPAGPKRTSLITWKCTDRIKE